jgi:thiaminase
MNKNFFQAIQKMQQFQNPQQAFMAMIQQNPQMQQQMAQMQNISGGRSVEQTVRQLAKQQGISEEQLMQAYNSLANKR